MLQQQVRRMLADPRSDALILNFAGQWLHLRNVDTSTARPGHVSRSTSRSAQAVPHETELFVSSIFRDDRSLLDLLTADYTFVNERLAEHYGIPRSTVAVPPGVVQRSQSARLLGQGSILTVTSYPNRTSVVLRGKWILENLLARRRRPRRPTCRS